MEDNYEYKNKKCLNFLFFLFNLLILLEGILFVALLIVIFIKLDFQNIIIIFIPISILLIINSFIGFFFKSKNKINATITFISFVYLAILSLLFFLNKDSKFVSEKKKDDFKKYKIYCKILLLSSCIECIIIFIIIFYNLNNNRNKTNNNPSLLKNISGLRGEDLLKGVNFNVDNDILS